jgi:hypothetical protein
LKHPKRGHKFSHCMTGGLHLSQMKPTLLESLIRYQQRNKGNPGRLSPAGESFEFYSSLKLQTQICKCCKWPCTNLQKDYASAQTLTNLQVAPGVNLQNNSHWNFNSRPSAIGFLRILTRHSWVHAPHIKLAVPMERESWQKHKVLPLALHTYGKNTKCCHWLALHLTKACEWYRLHGANVAQRN